MHKPIIIDLTTEEDLEMPPFEIVSVEDMDSPVARVPAGTVLTDGLLSSIWTEYRRTMQMVPEGRVAELAAEEGNA